MRPYDRGAWLSAGVLRDTRSASCCDWWRKSDRRRQSTIKSSLQATLVFGGCAPPQPNQQKARLHPERGLFVVRMVRLDRKR